MGLGVAGGPGFLEDQASVALGFIGLYELTFDRVWLHRATTIARARAAIAQCIESRDAGTQKRCGFHRVEYRWHQR